MKSRLLKKKSAITKYGFLLQCICLSFLISGNSFALQQGNTISGQVTSADDKAGLPGVNVIIKGTSIGTVTDIQGRYSLEVQDQTAVLAYSSVGFTRQEITVGNQSVIDVVLIADLTALEEIVVVGYGTMRKSDVTGSVSRRR